MSNIIKERIADFLKYHPPFSFINNDELLQIAARIIVRFIEKDTVLFRQGEPASDRFYIVREGAVELTNQIDGQEVLTDKCDEGDIFGIRSIIAPDQPYTLTARAHEESLIYSIPADSLIRLVDRNESVKDFFDTVFTAGIRNPYIKYSRYKQTSNKIPGNEILSGLSEIQTPRLNRRVVTCRKEADIQEAANLMRTNKIGSIVIVNNEDHPIGIFTDRDLRNKVVTGDVGITEPVSAIMTSPVITCEKELSYTEIQILMIRFNIHHLCITADGTVNSQVLGIVSEHDILLAHGNDPSVLIREAQRSDSAGQLREIRIKAEELLRSFIDRELSVAYVTRIMSEINSAIVRRSIELSIDLIPDNAPDVKWCWLAIGSQGREEQLLTGDQDNALVFDDVSDEQYRVVKDYFLNLSDKVNRMLNECGFDFCPSEMMARNPRWCLSVSDWKSQFSNWIHSPGDEELMYSTIFFDFTPVYGDYSLADQLHDSIQSDISRQSSFLSFLAKNALQNPPPLSFFRNIMVEHNGEHKDEFDIKARAMMPVVDGARVLALSRGITESSNTVKRLRHLSEIENENSDLYESLIEQYELLIRFRTLQGLKHNNSGRYFNPTDLNKLQRHLLRNSFMPIKDLQSLLTTRFQLNQFR